MTEKQKQHWVGLFLRYAEWHYKNPTEKYYEKHYLGLKKILVDEVGLSNSKILELESPHKNGTSRG